MNQGRRFRRNQGFSVGDSTTVSRSCNSGGESGILCLLVGIRDTRDENPLGDVLKSVLGDWEPVRGGWIRD